MAQGGLPQEVLDGFAASFAVVCAFVTDPAGKLLIVKPTYRDHWQFVGGMVDRGETPHEACAREVKEEIGVDLRVGDLLVLDYVPDHEFVAAPMTIYIFDCGVIDEPDQIRLQENELAEFAFDPLDEVLRKFLPVHQALVGLAIGAHRTGRTAFQPRVGPLQA
ncbi:MAG TPA: NUDIX hydrolase [Glycomyces sp.]|nr:NUDIX hydrolase [Glycomyces sp.]